MIFLLPLRLVRAMVNALTQTIHRHFLLIQTTHRHIPQKQDCGRSSATKISRKKGLQAKTRGKEVEPGNDDCGDDLGGLGDVHMHLYDVYNETIEADDGDDLHLTLPITPSVTEANVLSVVPTLCYGQEYKTLTLIFLNLVRNKIR